MALVAVFITETLLLLVTYTYVPVGFTAIPPRGPPTFTVAVTVFMAVLITEMLPTVEAGAPLLSPWFAT
jgi:hypothetical protein